MKQLLIFTSLCSYHASCTMEKEIRNSLLNNDTASTAIDISEPRPTITPPAENHRRSSTCCGDTPQERCVNRFLMVNTVGAVALTVYLVSLMAQTSGSCNQS